MQKEECSGDVRGNGLFGRQWMCSGGGRNEGKGKQKGDSGKAHWTWRLHLKQSEKMPCFGESVLLSQEGRRDKITCSSIPLLSRSKPDTGLTMYVMDMLDTNLLHQVKASPSKRASQLSKVTGWDR